MDMDVSDSSNAIKDDISSSAKRDGNVHYCYHPKSHSLAVVRAGKGSLIYKCRGNLGHLDIRKCFCKNVCGCA